MATIIEELRQRVQLERRLIARLKTANIRFTDAQVERIWAIVSAHQAGLSIRKIAGATGLSSSRIHQLLNAPEAKEIPVWLSQLRQSSRGAGGKKRAERPESETEIRSRLAREVEVLRRCTDWLQRLERGENVVVNLRPDEDFETEFVAFDRPWVVRVLERIAADLDTLSLVPNDPHADKESNHHDPRARHRHELAAPSREPKKLSHRKQRTA
jgi:DNA-binding transcriptional MerR regulator